MMKDVSINFTIVTPSFNYGHFIEDCLKSVAIQHGVILEHLIYDAGSTDDTLKVIAKYPHAKVVQESDKGMSDAINKGFKAAKGEWVMWLNADDLLKPGALKAILEFSQGKGHDVIYSGWDFVDTEGGMIRAMTLFPFQKKMMHYLICYIGSTAAFYRRETVIDEGHYLNEDFRYVMDGEYYNRLASLGKQFGYFHARIADFRMHGDNLSLRHRNKENRTASDELVRQKQFAESLTIVRCYGQQLVKNSPWIWFVDGVLNVFFKIQKFLLKRIYRWMVPLKKLEELSIRDGESK